MLRLSLGLTFGVCVMMCMGIVFAGDDPPEGGDHVVPPKMSKRGGTVRGIVVATPAPLTPVEGVEVVIYAPDGPEYRVITDADGNYERRGIPAGKYFVNIYEEGYDGDRLGVPVTGLPVTVVEGGNHDVSFKMLKGAFKIPKPSGPGTVSGRIIDTTAAQNPIGDVNVLIYAPDGPEYKEITDATGNFEYSSIPAGIYFINIYREGYEDRQDIPIRVVKDGDHRVSFRMPKLHGTVRGGTVRGQVIETPLPHNPIEGAEVVISDPDGPEYKARADAGGNYECSGIPAGRYFISSYREGYRYLLPRDPITVVDGGDHVVPLQMANELRGTVSGRIVDTTAAQNPIEGVSFVIYDPNDREYAYWARTDATGNFERWGIPAGRYLIGIYRDGYWDRLGIPFTVVESGDHFVPLEMHEGPREMTKQESIVTIILKKFGSLFSTLLLRGIPALLTFVLTLRL